MHFRNKNLCEILNQYQKIIIYGTGNYAQQIYPQLVKGNLKDKIVCFTQTRDAGSVFIDGIQVMNFDTLNFDRAECVVLIAVSELYTDEIKQILTERGYVNIISLIDYRLDYQQTEQAVRYLETFEEYCEYIADWYVETHEDSADKGTVINELVNRGNCVDKNKDLSQIVVICGHVSSRINKIIGALKRKKYNIIMLNYCPNVNPWCLEELQSTIGQIYMCECVEEMMYRALQYSPLVYFFEPRWGDCLWAEIMLKKKQYFGRVVLTLYDVLNDGYINVKASSLAAEKYALEHADGIVWRWFSKEYLEEKKGFRYQGKSLQFVDYASHGVNNSAEEDIMSSVLKLCEVVGYGDVIVEKRTYDRQYVDFARLEEMLEKVGNRKDCIFHFYAGALNSENIKVCEQYEKKYTNFRFFVGTEHSELLNRLGKYDYMCFLYTDGEEPADDTPVGNYCYGSMYRNGIRNAFFDCVYAGLPVITTFAEKLWEHLSAYDIVVKMNLHQFDIDNLKQNKMNYKDKMKVAKKELDIDNHIQKLIDFFNEL